MTPMPSAGSPTAGVLSAGVGRVTLLIEETRRSKRAALNREGRPEAMRDVDDALNNLLQAIVAEEELARANA